MPLPTLYIMVGIPGAGKTTWAEHFLPPPIETVRLDRIRHSVYGEFPQTLDSARESEVWSVAYNQMGEALVRGVSVVLDSMALTREWRQRHVREADRRAGRRARHVVVFLDTPVETAVVRNAGRDKCLLERTVREMAVHLEPPSPEEEFDEVIRVSPQMGGPWSVRQKTPG